MAPGRWSLANSLSSRTSRSEEHTFELQSPCNLVCRLLLEKKHRTWHDAGRAERGGHSEAERTDEQCAYRTAAMITRSVASRLHQERIQREQLVFFNDTAASATYSLSRRHALPI